MKKRTLLSTLFLFAFLSNLFATHNAAGYIAYKQLDDNSIEASIITFTNTSSVAASRDSLTICWGDGNCETITRINGPDNNMNDVPDGEPIDAFFSINIYTAQHTYTEFGEYTLSMTDPNRVSGILNINFPNSVMVPFHIETWFTLNPLTIGETNQSPVILEPPISWAFVDQPWLYISNAFDIDGDQISYELIAPFSNINTQVPNYQFPCDINTNPPTGPNICSINQTTGMLSWDSPQVAGKYVFAIAIKSFRNNEFIGEMVLDFMVVVEDDPDLYPDIQIENALVNVTNPVNIGDTVRFDVLASDPDNTQEIEITSSSGLYDYFDENATFESVTNGNTGTAAFEWLVKDEHLREQPYFVVIKVIDNDLDYPKTSYEVIRYQFEEFITSTHKITQKIDFQLFPNPATHNKINLLIDDFKDKTNLFTIYDSLGKLIKSGETFSGLTEIDVSNLQSGIYILKVGKGKNSISKSFVVH